MTEADLPLIPYRIKSHRRRGPVEKAGLSYEVSSQRSQRYVSYNSNGLTKKTGSPGPDTPTGRGSPVATGWESCLDDEYLFDLKASEWKEQDHYRVLGLHKARHLATEEDIKRAYKKIVRKHHPDKKGGECESTAKDNYFACITKAWETLGDAAKRRAYDSIDPEFDDSLPSSGKVPVSATAKADFYRAYGAAFSLNARWSVGQPVPKLGNQKSTYDEVNHFYSFWYDFESWREYSYLDEEDKEKGDNRYERRMIEVDNKKLRQKRKKEEVSRLRQLVDNAYAMDPRIQQFKEEGKAKKLAAKQEKREALKAKAAEEERKRQEVEEAARKVKAAEEEAERAKAAVVKKDKEQQKAAVKKERKLFRNKLKEFDYFSSVSHGAKLHNMQEMDRLLESLSLLSLKSLNETMKDSDQKAARTTFMAEIEKMDRQKDDERTAQLGQSAGSGGKASGDAESGRKTKEWTDQEIQLLIKGVNLFPAGTANRWEVVAEFIKQHIPDSKHTAKDVLSKAKGMQKMDPSNKNTANNSAFDKFVKGSVGTKPTAATAGTANAVAPAEHSNPSQRYMSPGETVAAETGVNPTPWSPEEQKLLEQALRTYPGSTPERWERIADCVPERTKKDCMIRFKELAELVKAKKLGALAAKKK